MTDRIVPPCEAVAGDSRRVGARYRHLIARMLWSLVWATAAFFSATASATAAGRVAIAVEGPNGDRLRTELVSALPAGIDVIDDAKLAPALSRQRIRNLSAELANARRRPALTAKLRRAARAIGANAIVVGAVPAGKSRGGLELRLLVVRTAKKGAVVDETIRFSRGESRANRWRTVLGGALEDLGSASEQAAAAATKAEDEAAAKTEDAQPAEAQDKPEGQQEGKQAGKQVGKRAGKDAADSSAETSGDAEEGTEAEESQPAGNVTPTDALVVGFLGLDFGGRQFHYNQRITEANLRPYDLPESALLPATPGGALSIELYPLARYQIDWVRDVGVAFSGRYNLAKAKVGTTTLDTSWYAWEASLRGRYHLGARGASPSVGLELGLGQEVFKFNGAAALSDILPGVDYHYFRIGADGRIPTGMVDVIVGLAYRNVRKTGGSMRTIEGHFPRASISGMDAKVGAALKLREGLEARLTLTYVRFWASFNSNPGDPYIAGGALDHMIHADLGIAAYY